MQKPWMCCHMLSALDGGISGSFMELETTEALARSYASIRSAYQADAWISACDDEGICRTLCTKRSGKCL
ncbi:MAG: hypothetical protein ACLVJ6_01350 [Merdibacter sp.]